MTRRPVTGSRSRSRHLLLAPSWWPWHLLAFLLVSTFLSLGVWQLDRHDQRRALVTVLEARRQAAVVQLEEVLPRLDEDALLGTPADAHDVRVRTEGTFLEADTVLWRNRSFEGVPGHHVVTPLRLRSDPGRAILVDRGWVSYVDAPDVTVHDARDGASSGASPGASDATTWVEGYLVPEADDPTGPLAALAPRDPVDGPFTSLARIDVDRLQDQIDVALERFVLVATVANVVREDARTDTGGERTQAQPVPSTPVPVPQEDLGPGPHRSYALQWFGFAVVVATGYAALLRSRYRILSGIERDPRTPPTSPSAT